MKRNDLRSDILGTIIKERRKSFGLTQEQLAGMLKPTYTDNSKEQTYLSRLETGRDYPPLETLIDLAENLDLKHDPGMFVNALVGMVDEKELRKKASILQVPEDFTPAEWAELRNALLFILWKRNKSIELVDGVPTTRPNPDLHTYTEIMQMALSGMENAIEVGENINNNNQIVETKPVADDN